MEELTFKEQDMLEQDQEEAYAEFKQLQAEQEVETYIEANTPELN